MQPRRVSARFQPSYSRRKVIHEKLSEKIDPRACRCGCCADAVARRRLAGSRAIRTYAPGADGLPFGCRKILRRTCRQAAADECLPAREQGEAVGWLPQGGGIARRVTDDGTACTASCPQSRSSERWSGMTNQRKVITLQARIVKGSINHPDRTA